MPQLDPSTFLPQLFWLAVIFGALYYVMSRVALPRVASVLEERRGRIAGDLDQAAHLRAKAEEALAAYEQGLAEARMRAEALARETRDRLNAESEERRKTLEAQLSARLAEAEARIGEVKQQAMNNVRAIAAEAAETFVEQLIGEKPDRGSVEAAVDTVMAA